MVRLVQQHNSAAGPPGPMCSKRFLPHEKLYPREIYASGGDLTHGTQNVPHLFTQQRTYRNGRACVDRVSSEN